MLSFALGTNYSSLCMGVRDDGSPHLNV